MLAVLTGSVAVLVRIALLSGVQSPSATARALLLLFAETLLLLLGIVSITGDMFSATVIDFVRNV